MSVVIFTEASTVENMIHDLLCGGVTHHTAVGAGLARRSGKISGLGWHYLAPANIPRQPHEVFVERWIREATSSSWTVRKRGIYA